MTSCIDLARHHVVDQITIVLYSNSYYTALLLVKQYVE